MRRSFRASICWTYVWHAVAATYLYYVILLQFYQPRNGVTFVCAMRFISAEYTIVLLHYSNSPPVRRIRTKTKFSRFSGIVTHIQFLNEQNSPRHSRWFCFRFIWEEIKSKEQEKEEGSMWLFCVSTKYFVSSFQSIRSIKKFNKIYLTFHIVRVAAPLEQYMAGAIKVTNTV